ncbi:DNA polymerase III subunit gamma/tau [Chamaesiphon sp.]|uniref:DNA polymerase III subunit gamma/tau n=1 Tax=Chamaesiphon sp. TaxID=2814140 RepID=UPI003594451C
MAYIPLHHKYRPQTFADLVGQAAIATTLTNALRLEKIAPAYLFTGPRGTGKTSSARILAKSLNCMASQVPTAQPCGKCEVCNSIALGAALDIIEIDAASNTGVDNIREIIERAQYAPVQCRYKVYIIDECHMLTTAAFNSLLKTLEEPPDRVVFVLATTDPQRVLPTIISRCQRFDYRRIPVADMVAHLIYIAKVEQIAIAPAAVTLIAQIAQGGLRDAESLLDRLSLLDGEITPDRVSDAIGSVPERDLLGILQAIVSADPESLLDRTRQILERGKEPLIVLQNLAGCYRDLAIAKTAPQRADLAALTPETWVELVKIAQSCQLDWILAGQTHLKDSEIQLKQTTQPQLWLEIAIFGLMTLSTQSAPAIASIPPPPAITPQAAPALPPSQPASVAPPNQISSNTTPPPIAVTAPQTAIGSEDLASTWERVLQQLLPASRDLFKPFGKLVSISQTQAVVAMKSSTMQTIAAGKVPELAKVFTHIYGRSISVKLEVLGKSQPQPSSLPPSPPPAAIVIDPPPTTSVVPLAGYLTDDVEAEDLSNESEAEIEPTIVPSVPVPNSLPTLIPLAQVDVVEPAPAPEPPADFAEPPESLDAERAIHTPLSESEDLEFDPLLEMATANLVKTFNGEIIDRTHDLFDKIVGN